MRAIKHSNYNEIVLFLMSVLSYDLRQRINFDFLDKMDPYWWKRFAIKFQGKKYEKGKVRQKLRKIFYKLQTRQLRSFDAALAEIILIDKDARRERILAIFLLSNSRTLSQYLEVLKYVRIILTESETDYLLNTIFTKAMNLKDKYEHQKEMLLFLEITENIDSFKERREQINQYWGANNETMVGVPTSGSMYN